MWLCMDCAKKYPQLGVMRDEAIRVCDECHKSQMIWQFEPNQPENLRDWQVWLRALVVLFQLLAGWVLGSFTVPFAALSLLMGIGFWMYGNAQISQYSAQVQGKVITVQEDYFCKHVLIGRGLCKTFSHYMTYEYTPPETGNTYRETVWITWSYYSIFITGQTILVRYMPDHPERSHLNEFDFLQQVPILWAIVAAVSVLFTNYIPRHKRASVKSS